MKKVSITLVVILIAAGFLQLSGNHMPLANKFNNDNSAPQNLLNDKGIGPFKNVTLAPIDKEKVKTGMSIYNNKCALCHELDINKIGPPLRNAVKTYSPEFILNMIVNPLEMQKSNESVKALLKKYNNVPMVDQKITQQDALNILEYLRSVVK